jgi:MFS family permease
MELSNTVSTKNGRSKSRKILIEVALCTICALIFIDTVIVSTALPSIARKLQASGAQYAWVASSYLLALASLLPLWAKLSDIFGRKLVMLVGNALFLLGSLVSALSERISMLIAGRGIQGAGAGALVVLSNICIADMFSLR